MLRLIRELATTLAQTADTSRLEWQNSARSPLLKELSTSISPAETQLATNIASSNSTVSETSGRSPSVDSHHPTYMSASMDSLTGRGKGQYRCPHGASCTKGGVLPSGELAVFERNSAFRMHLQKHEKRYRCNIPGCTNKTGFARVDQLERHKRDVKHF